MVDPPPPDDPDERCDDEAAAAQVGKVALVGVAFVELRGERQVQMFGTVLRAERGRGIDIELGGERAGEVFTLPPDTLAFCKAAPGHYRLRGSGAVVVDPDYTVVYAVYPKRDPA